MPDVEQLVIGGAAMLPLVIWLVQLFKEAFNVDGKYLPLITLGCASVLEAVVIFAPVDLSKLVGTALTLAVTANMSIRYTKSSTPAETNKQENTNP